MDKIAWFGKAASAPFVIMVVGKIVFEFGLLIGVIEPAAGLMATFTSVAVFIGIFIYLVERWPFNLKGTT